MRVFVTGATGFIGSAIVQELLRGGHQVLGLTRSDAGAAALEAAGAQVHRGALEDVDSLQRGAAAAQAVIHTAFIHDFQNFGASIVADERAIDAMTATLAGTGKRFIVTGGTLGLPLGRTGTEVDVLDPQAPRRSEAAGHAAAAKGVCAMVLRLPPSVHGSGDHGFVPALIALAREKGFSAYVGEGNQRWPTVHRLDAARLYRLALEKGTSGANFHGVANQGTPVREIAELIARRVGVKAVSKTPEEAMALLGFIGHVLALDSPASSALTQERLGWAPTQPALMHELEHGDYFEVRSAAK